LSGADAGGVTGTEQCGNALIQAIKKGSLLAAFLAGPVRLWKFTWEKDHAWVNSDDYPRQS
jgi:hypothetical protein